MLAAAEADGLAVEHRLATTRAVEEGRDTLTASLTASGASQHQSRFKAATAATWLGPEALVARPLVRPTSTFLAGGQGLAAHRRTEFVM